MREGEVVIIFGGRIFTTEDVRAGRAKPDSLAGVGEGIYMGQLPGDPDSPDQFLNHSCDPNLWMLNEVEVAARRRIGRGEELTADYAMWEIDPNWQLLAACRCGSALCRGRITGQDWQLISLQSEYEGHFIPCLNERIAHLRTQHRRSAWNPL